MTGSRLIIPGAVPMREPIAPPPATGNIDPATITIEGDFAIVDVETTGVDPDADGIVEIAVVRFRGREREVFQSLVNPGFPIPPTASAVHGITDDDVADAPAIGDLADQVCELLDGSIPVSHVTDFDSLFVDPPLGVEPDPRAWICSFRLSRHLFPLAPAHGNQVLRYWLKTKPRLTGLGPHRALDDCLVTQESLLHMLALCQQRGLTNIEQVLALANQPIISTTCPFFKHAGKPWAEVPLDYISWLLRERQDLDNDMLLTLQQEMARRRRGALATRATGPATVMTFGRAHFGEPLAQVPTE
jgi:exodeoxyribonuclease X